MAFSCAVQWWEEWQLRILVLSSLVIQCYLSFFSSARKKHIRPLYRFTIWLAYLGQDAVVIYALATLFNRQRKARYSSVDASHSIEVLWAPILLMHLGGQVSISAYNIEDNELWRRHILTTVSQVAVALYVFCKSWSPSADVRLLGAAILLFFLGVFKCFERSLALQRNSFNSLVTSFYPSPRAKNINREVELEEYIQEARDFVIHSKDTQTWEGRFAIDRLFVDSAYAYTDRLTKLKGLWRLADGKVYEALRTTLSETFDVIYSKESHFFTASYDHLRDAMLFGNWLSVLLWFFALTLPASSIILFHGSHKGAYRSSDIKVTFSLLYVTYLLEISSYFTVAYFADDWPDVVAQHSLIRYLARDRRHTRFMRIAELLRCKGLLDTYFCFKPCYSSAAIIHLVQGNVKNGWMNYISDIESYWKFSDIRGHWTLEQNGCEENLQESIEKPFDESILLWHVATDFCFHHMGSSRDPRCARLCREISNYMVHLLFANPEMLIPGSRPTLFTDAYNELEVILRGEDLSLLDEKQLTEKIIEKMGSNEEGLVHDSLVVAQDLMELGEEKMWEVIKGVWIEMLCFSAGRCRGYLHAKSLGSGGEYLSFVSLLMSHAGLETFAERQQRIQLRLPKEERVKIAKQRIQEAARNKATGGPSTPHGTPVPMKEEENAAILSGSKVHETLKEEGNTTTTSASQGERVSPSPAIKIVVSP